MDDVIFAHNVPFGGMSLDTDVPYLVTSLRRRALANAPDASYWLHRVLENGGCLDWMSPSCNCYLRRSLQCTIGLTMTAHSVDTITLLQNL